MPKKETLKLIVGSQPTDLRNIRLPGLDKPFEQLTISELVQLRPGSEVSDTYEVNAVTDNISATTSAALEALGRVHKDRVMNQVLQQSRLTELEAKLSPSLGRVAATGARGFSAETGNDKVALSEPEADVFKLNYGTDPFKA